MNTLSKRPEHCLHPVYFTEGFKPENRCDAISAQCDNCSFNKKFSEKVPERINKVAIDLNQTAEVELTFTGLGIYFQHLSALRTTPELYYSSLDKLVENNYKLKTQVWDLFNIFGESIHLGMSESPFKENQILVKGESK